MLSSVLSSQLRESAHALLYLGEDNSPIYAVDFCRLNAEVYRLINELYPLHGSSDVDEAGICLALLMGFSVTIYTPEDREAKIQYVLDRAFDVLHRLKPSLLKCQLLLYCYAQVQDDALKAEAKEIIMSWGGRELTDEEKETILTKVM